MVHTRCPGKDMQFWRPEDIYEVSCPFCGNQIEFFKDDPALVCNRCQKRVLNPKINRDCEQWCRSAEECIGMKAAPPIDTAEQCQRITERMKEVFGDDYRRIEHSLKVLGYANAIMKKEKGLSIQVVQAAAILHDIGIQAAERKYNSTAGKHQELEGPPIARRILEELHIAPEDIEHICRIIANHHSAKNIDTKEFRVVWDADWLVNIPDEYNLADSPRILKLINKVFKTTTGRSIALQTFGSD